MPPSAWPLPPLRWPPLPWPWLFLFPFLVLSCKETNHPNTLFTKLDPEISGIHFNNTITENDSVNLIADEYAYMGSGVGVGDFNNDGLPDLFFGGSQTTCRLYLNLGNHHFRDITKTAGLETTSWSTGISIVDINNDGYPDIYVCVSGNVPGAKRKNLLFINNHDLTFKECAAEYGLADTGYSTQAAFFDYDHDGRLDMYLVQQELHPAVSQNDILKPDTSGQSIRSDKLYRNMGILPGTNHPWFKDVSLAAGIKDDGYGLGLVVSDFNGDGWPDVYVTNDYLSNDLLWINNGDGTFTNAIAESLGHQSYSSMGVDAADINNDGLPDIATLDMMPEDNYRKKMMYSFMTYERYESERRAGYQPEFTRNMLQLNRGSRQTNPVARQTNPVARQTPDTTPAPSPSGPAPALGPLSHRAAIPTATLYPSPSRLSTSSSILYPSPSRRSTSSSTLYPSPSRRSLSSSTYYPSPPRRSTSSSTYYPSPSRLSPSSSTPSPRTPQPPTPYFSEIGQLAGISETDWSWSVLLADFDNDGYKDISITNGTGRDLINADFIRYRAETYGQIDKATRDQLLRSKLDSMGKIALRKYYFHNNGDGTFSNQSQLSGIDEKAIANGAVYVDLDNDGDLDLVVNNINQQASIYINNTRQPDNNREPNTSARESATPKSNASPTPNASTHEANRFPRDPNAANHYVNFVLHGDSLNRDGFGATIMLWQKDRVQSLEQNPVRGYASSVDPRLHFGLGNSGRPDSATIIWPNGKKQHLQNIAIDTTLTLNEANAAIEAPNAASPIIAAPPRNSRSSPFIAPTSSRNSRLSPSPVSISGSRNPRLSPLPVSLTGSRNSSRPPLPIDLTGSQNSRSSPFIAPTSSRNSRLPPSPVSLTGSRSPRPSPLLTDITDSLQVNFKHRETFFNDFAFNSLLPQKYSQLGPFISTGDVNGDGLTDFFIGGAYNQSGEIWLQQKNGRFLGKKLVPATKHEEDMQSILVDVDGDHDLDLIVVGGSTEFDKGSRFLTPRLYLNDGKGNFTLSPTAFPPSVNTIAQTISFTGAAAQAPPQAPEQASPGATGPAVPQAPEQASPDATGPAALPARDQARRPAPSQGPPATSAAAHRPAAAQAPPQAPDQASPSATGPAAPQAPNQSRPREAAPLRVFIGGRVSLDYPYSPKSYLLEYKNGAFVDITEQICPALSEAGMVTASVWADLDGDGQDELIIAGDWMPIRIFKSDHGQLKELSDSAGLSSNYGMWKSLAVADVDGDGDLDIIAGNLGTNNPYNVSPETPMRLIAKDFQGNGRIDPLLCYYIPDETGKKTLELGMNLNQLARQLPSFKTRFKTNVDFANANLAEQLPDEMLMDALTLNCNELHTCWFENLGNGKFRKHILPVEAQFAPVNAILARDFDEDGKLDLLLAGNEYQAEVVTGRYDAAYGLLLQGQGHGNFLPITNIAQGIFIKGDVKDIKCINNGKGDKLILVGVNNDRMRIFSRIPRQAPEPSPHR